MDMNTMDRLLTKYMLGEARLTEIETIDKWIAASKQNLEYFTQFKLVWEICELVKPESQIDIEEAWEKFKKMAKRGKGPAAIINMILQIVKAPALIN
ncbi:hypothetical protein [Mucilaginibacter sp. SG564]|uniref:hypothetical protein n=2 Tax=unclassified Mucilaginibacter TaxID=2617802 RepID=UPI001553FD55|nr:hypothetical protein [Mucilaginibacter sp. SG564]NOW99102.1 hypothetical protein [Mucilaginibacter sp. SG564]